MIKKALSLIIILSFFNTGPRLEARIDPAPDQNPKESQIQSGEMKKYLFEQKQKENELRWNKYQESPGRRFKTLFFISWPFSLILVFGSVQIYGLTMAGDNAFQLQSVHTAGLILGSGFLSLATAYKGYADYIDRREKVRREIFGDVHSWEWENNRPAGDFYFIDPEIKAMNRDKMALNLTLALIRF